MAYIPKRMYQGQLSATLTTTLATVTALKTWIVKEITVINTDTTARAVTLRMPGSAAGAEILSAASVNAGETMQIQGHWVLAAGETITGGADVANKVTVQIHGAEG